MVKIYSWNVNGIRAAVNKGAFEPFIKQHQPDILCLQETKALEGQAAIDLPAYNEYWNSADKLGYSGTAIFSKFEPLNVSLGFPGSIASNYSLTDDKTRDAAMEGRVITAEYKQCYVVCVYTPNAKDDLSRLPLRESHWDPAFLAYCQSLDKKKPVIFGGDLNVACGPDDLARPEPNEGKKGYTKEERQGFQNYLDAGFVDSFRLFHKGNGHYTWWTHWANARARNVGWRIDYFLVSGSLRSKVKSADIYSEVMGSDHCPISIGLDLTL